MRGFRLVGATAGAAAILTGPALACPPPAYYPPPVLPGESDEAYRVRIDQQTRRDAEAQRVAMETAQWTREDLLWRTADQIVVMGVISASRVREDRDGNPYQLVTLRQIATERGRGSPRRLTLRRYASGSMCLASAGPEYPVTGTLVLFARTGRLGDATVIDWSSAARSTHPATLSLLDRASGAAGL